MSQPEKLSEIIPNEIALAAGKQVIAKAVEMAVHAIDETADPEVRADLETEFHDRLVESGVPVLIPEQSELVPIVDHQRKGFQTNRTRDEVILDTTILFWAKQRGLLPRPKRLR